MIKKLDEGTATFKITSEMGVRKTQIKSSLKCRAELVCDYENIAPAESTRHQYFTGNEEIN